MAQNKPCVEIYTDGACSGNPGPGGWAVILVYGKHEKELSGGEPHTTNNRMELKAAVQGLRALNTPCRVKLFSDSTYLVSAFNRGWLKKWQKNGWKTSKKDPVENQDLWKELLDLSSKHEIEWVWIKGHAEDTYNQRCDRLAVEAAKASGFV
ncbi:MAG: ribonuclease HI [Peptococcaceae bacterium]|jgi:ribonuclease HI|nr:ribonuclease HI [Peptococcaceae bacterium]MDH7525208.1 ribonuclease HI [Peptococcaceae bacterium]